MRCVGVVDKLPAFKAARLVAAAYFGAATVTSAGRSTRSAIR